MKVLKYPDPFLFKKVKEVTIFDSLLKSEVEEMFKVMKESQGIGLAANQVGIDKKIFIMHCHQEKEPYIFINPFIKEYSEEKQIYQEGCLSFPKLYIDIERKNNVQLEWKDIEGNIKQESFKDLEAICIQHELDHLDGILFINQLKPMRKQVVLKKYMKLK